MRVKGASDVVVEDDSPENEISYALLEALLGNSLKVETVAPNCSKAYTLSFEG